jgi:hypothetical protein
MSTCFGAALITHNKSSNKHHTHPISQTFGLIAADNLWAYLVFFLLSFFLL